MHERFLNIYVAFSHIAFAEKALILVAACNVALDGFINGQHRFQRIAGENTAMPLRAIMGAAGLADLRSIYSNKPDFVPADVNSIAIGHPHLLAIFSRNDGEVRLIGHGRGDENPAGQ